MEEGVYDSAPSEVRERAQERIGLMTRACLTDDPAEYARLRAQLLEGDIADFKAGNLVGPTEKSLESQYRFFIQLSEQNDARIYKTFSRSSRAVLLRRRLQLPAVVDVGAAVYCVGGIAQPRGSG